MSNIEDFVIKDSVLKKYIGPGGDVIVPDGITVIGKKAFSDNSAITSISMPNGITKIDSEAFSFCKELKNASLPDTVKTIGNRAFFYCSKLMDVNMPAQLEKIGDNAFYNCKLTMINLPSAIKSIGEEAFEGTWSIQSFKIPDKIFKEIGITKLKKIIDIDRLESAMIAEPDYFEGLLKDKLITRVQKNFDKLAQERIKNDDINELSNLLELKKKVDIGIIDGLISYAESLDIECPNAIAYLLNYKHQRYPDNVIQKLSEENMEKDLGIRERTVSDWRKIFKFSTRNGETKILDYLGTDSIVEIPEHIGNNTVTEIGENAFSRYHELTELFIPDTVMRVGRSAFEFCENLKNLHIGANLTQIAPYAFHGCPGLQDGSGFVIVNNQLIQYLGNKTDVVIPDGITRIGEGAFSFKSAITSIHIPDSVEEIGEMAFLGCEGLADSDGFIIVRNTLYGYSCKEENVLIPDGVTHISGSVFEGYRSCGPHVQLEALRVPSSVTEIYLDHYAYDYIPAKKMIGEAGSYAETFAKENNIPFVAE